MQTGSAQIAAGSERTPFREHGGHDGGRQKAQRGHGKAHVVRRSARERASARAVDEPRQRRERAVRRVRQEQGRPNGRRRAGRGDARRRLPLLRVERLCGRALRSRRRVRGAERGRVRRVHARQRRPVRKGLQRPIAGAKGLRRAERRDGHPGDAALARAPRLPGDRERRVVEEERDEIRRRDLRPAERERVRRRGVAEPVHLAPVRGRRPGAKGGCLQNAVVGGVK